MLNHCSALKEKLPLRWADVVGCNLITPLPCLRTIRYARFDCFLSSGVDSLQRIGIIVLSLLSACALCVGYWSEHGSFRHLFHLLLARCLLLLVRAAILLVRAVVIAVVVEIALLVCPAPLPG